MCIYHLGMLTHSRPQQATLGECSPSLSLFNRKGKGKLFFPAKKRFKFNMKIVFFVTECWNRLPGY